MMDKQTYKAWLGLGGNVGDPVQAMAQALQLLDDRDDTRVIAVSPVYRTAPWGNTDQDWFHNSCAEIETSLSPQALLQCCLNIEKLLKRERSERWGPRTIDIDLLAYQGVFELNEAELTLPHPRIEQRAFVLVPLAAIAPQLMIRNHSVADLLKQLDISDVKITSHSHRWWRYL